MPSIAPIAYQIMTDRITKLIEEENLCAWTQPWNADAGMPRNLFSRRPYRGINIWMLGAQGYESPYWGSFNQVKQAGGNIRKGEKSTPIVFWKVYDVETAEGKDRRFTLRYYNVFNANQMEGIAIPQIETVEREHTPIECCEKIVGNYPNPPTIIHGYSAAYYRPVKDLVAMPDMARFSTASGYYATLFHELVHSTGHSSRLNRPTLVDAVPYGQVNYAKEELVAEFGAAYLCGVAGIDNETVDNSAAYLKGWLKPLRDDVKMLVTAAGQAQRAVDHILSTSWREPGEGDE